MDALYLLGLAWIGGLLAHSWAWGWVLPLLIGLAGAALTRHQPRLLRTWLCVGLVGFVAWFYLSIRLPRPAGDDISIQPQVGSGVLVGKVLTSPRTTRSQRQQVWLEASEWTPKEGETVPVSGKVYLTIGARPSRTEPGADIPPEPETKPAVLNLYPSQVLALQGSLYLPKPAQNPGGFDFQNYLRQQGSFAGFSANQVEIRDPGSLYGGWAMRQRIRQALIAGLGPEQGELLSSLVIGSRAADLSQELSAAFREVGLAHVLAASGFQVSLIVGVVMALTSRLGIRPRQLTTLGVIGLYVVLTGLSAPVLRAALMGAAVVVAQGDQRQIRLHTLSLLLLAAVLMLIWDPNSIDDLSFQLSFLATLGLIVGVDPIIQRLPWLPPVVATSLAVPIAAQFWVLPILLVVFGKINTYFLVANLLTVPLVTPLTIGGFVVCNLALVFPVLGALAAQPFQFLLTPLVNIVLWINSWPYTSHYTGPVGWWQCVALYALLFSLTFWPQWRTVVHWWGTFLLMAVVLVIPSFFPSPPVVITALSTDQVPVMVIRSQGETLLINSGSAKTMDLTVLPFLRQQGIRTIDDAVRLTFREDDDSGWELLHKAIPIQQFWSSDDFKIPNAAGIDYRKLEKIGEPLEIATLIRMVTVATRPLAIQMEVNGKDGSPVRWLLASSLSERQQRFLAQSQQMDKPIQWLWWPGTLLDSTFLSNLQIKGGIATGRRLGRGIDAWFEEQDYPLYQPYRDGSLRWTATSLTTQQAESP